MAFETACVTAPTVGTDTVTIGLAALTSLTVTPATPFTVAVTVLPALSTPALAIVPAGWVVLATATPIAPVPLLPVVTG